MTFLATRTRFGRYAYAIGGNPEAAELAGVNTRWVIMKIFMLMGLLTAVSAAISIARLDAATNSEGTLAELLVIAAAVIGGTSLSGGVGTRGRRDARRGADAIAAIGHGAAWRRYATAEHCRWRHSGLRRGPRHRLSAANQITQQTAMSTRPRCLSSKCATSRSRSAAFAPSSGPRSISTKARSWRSSAITAPASRR